MFIALVFAAWFTLALAVMAMEERED